MLRKSFTRLSASSALVNSTPESANTPATVNPPTTSVTKAGLHQTSIAPMPSTTDPLSGPFSEFVRVPRHAKTKWISMTETARPTQIVPFIEPKPPAQHKWVPTQPIGEIRHGDGELRVVGTGEVLFQDDPVESLPVNMSSFRGLNPLVTVNVPLPTLNGEVHKGLMVMRSLELTGRGVFTTEPIPAGTQLTKLKSYGSHVGFDSHHFRVLEIVKQTMERSSKDDVHLDYFHRWVLTCQPASTLEKWTEKDLNDHMPMLGGQEALTKLEIHKRHIARLAAIVDLNNFLVESPLKEERGLGFWPEAALFNHSCAPNVDYEIVHDPETGECYFNCVAMKDLQPGEELLIAYVPPEWRFQDRQTAIRERYRFWCKCPKCSPDVDTKVNKIPRMLLFMAVIAMMIQGVVYKVHQDPGLVRLESDNPDGELRHEYRFVN